MSQDLRACVICERLTDDSHPCPICDAHAPCQLCRRYADVVEMRTITAGKKQLIVCAECYASEAPSAEQLDLIGGTA